MSYTTGHLIAMDQDLRNRAAIAAAEQGVPPGEEEHWVFVHARTLAIQPGWREAWESALANGVEHPGADEGVITDGMLRAAVAELLGIEVPPVEESP